jgi:hypothetical protein
MISPRHRLIFLAVLPSLTLLSAAGIYLSLFIAISTYNSLAPALTQRTAATIAIPWSAEYQVRLADLRRAAGLPFRPNLAAAVRSSSADSRLWIQLGLAEEQDGDFKSAEASFLRAAAFGQDYDTRWTLTNFYFRRADRDRAVLWACAVLSIPGVEAGPVFSLLSNFPAKPDCLLSGGFRGPESARLGYVQWLISKGSLDASSPVADLLIHRRKPESISALLDYCDRLLVAGKGEMAARLWNSMSSQGLVSAPLRVNSVMDALSAADSSHVLAWRIPVVPAPISFPCTRVYKSHSLLVSRIVVSCFPNGYSLGRVRRPMSCELGMFLPGSARIGSSTGKSVRPAGRIGMTSQCERPKSALETFAPFEGPPGAGLIRLSPGFYERAPGAAPAQGWIRLEKIWLTD